MRKKVVAIVIAFAITGIVALGMLVVGASAAFNRNGVAVSNSPAQSALTAPGSSTSSTGSTGSTATDPQAQIAQLQNEVAQYQTALQNAQTQLNQVQQLMNYLQQNGIISVDSQGNVTVNVRRHDDGFGGFGG